MNIKTLIVVALIVSSATVASAETWVMWGRMMSAIGSTSWSPNGFFPTQSACMNQLTWLVNGMAERYRKDGKFIKADSVSYTLKNERGIEFTTLYVCYPVGVDPQ